MDAEAYLRALAFLNGVRAYHKHPYKRDVKDPPAVWEQGGSALRPYGGPDDGPLLLAVPSLINRAYVLDLSRQRSFMRFMVKAGLNSYLLDWGQPGADEEAMNVEDYTLGRLADAVSFLEERHQRPVNLVGYCMGGVLTTAFAAMEPDRVASMALLATPWDFHAGNAAHKNVVMAARPQLQSLINIHKQLPIDVIQSLFAAIDPHQILKKFADFSEVEQDSAEAKKFVGMEDWLNDGVPLVGPVAEECLFDWYVHNKPSQSEWEMDGHLIRPEEVTCPSILFVPEKDRIVPPESALALGKQLANATTTMVPAGHIGMVTGRQATKKLYEPLSKWLLKNAK